MICILINGKRIYPDFVCLNVKRRKEIVWEHFGMVDNEDYANSMVNKINIYINNGYRFGDNFLMTFETMIYPINMQVVNSLIEEVILA